MSKKIILDTDIGDDIDDALCLALALKENMDVIGVTTVFRNARLRARLAKKIIAEHAKNIPVFSGYGQPIREGADEGAIFCQYSEDLLEDVYVPDGEDPQTAVDFILDAARKYGKDLEIIAIGPQTNIARAILTDAETMQGIGRVVCMGGAFFEQYREWNIVCDPEAAKVICDSSVAVEYIGHDVTIKCQLSKEQYQRLLHKLERAEGCLAQLVKKWVSHEGRLPILHDPLALWYAMGGDVTMKDVEVAIELEGCMTRGMTLDVRSMTKYYIPQPYRGKVHKVSYAVDGVRFIDYFIDKIFD